MLRYLIYSLAIILTSCQSEYASDEETLSEGKNLFSKYCTSCHGLEEDGFGPPLGGITVLLSQKALMNFVKNPSMAIEAGDERATWQFGRYKQVMPSFEWMREEDISSILSYVHQQTELHQIKALAMNGDTAPIGLTGRLVPPVIMSGLKIELEEVIEIPRMEGFSKDLGVVNLRPHPGGDGTLFVNDQNGIIYRISDGEAEIFLEMGEQINDYQSGPGIATGVGSFDFHPDFLKNGLLYITHAETYKGQIADYTAYADTLKSEVQWILSEWKMDNANDQVFKGTNRELLRLHASNFGHGAQDVGFIPDLEKSDQNYGLLYWGYGDGGSNNIKRPEVGHNLKSFLGTILRIDPAGNNSRNGKYGIPSDNPFVDETDPATVKEIYAYGFRNPHRIAWDAMNGNRMMATDIGESNIEEINIIEKGGDYGWPNREGSFGITTTKDLKSVYELAGSDLDLYKKPFAMYDHEEGNAISGGFVYEGDIEPLKNKYIFGDIVNGKLFYVNIDPQLSDSTVYELTITQNGLDTNLQEMSNTRRLHLRVGYDRFAKQLYVITKADGKIRRVLKAS